MLADGGHVFSFFKLQNSDRMPDMHNRLRKIYVSGCYDILHAGHIQFFNEAKQLGNYLIVSFASDEILRLHKSRRSSVPENHKRVILESLQMVDEVVIGNGKEIGLDFKDDFLRQKPDALVVTEDDQFQDIKKALCASISADYIILPKTPPSFQTTSTTHIIKKINAPKKVPLRIDIAGGWLDVPKFSRKNASVVNVTISPLVSLDDWQYEQESGLGGSAAWYILQGENATEKELEAGVGWQDPAVIQETGLCVWDSGKKPILEFKRNLKCSSIN